VIAAAAVCALAGAMGLGVSLAHAGHGAAALAGSDPPTSTASPPASTASPPSTAPATTWTQIVAHLDALRAEAFDRADADPLAQVYAPGAPAYQMDVATVRSLASRGLHAEGFAATVEHVNVESSTATTERLRVTDRLSGYTLVDAAGTIEGSGDGRKAKSFNLDLVRVDGAWRVTAITSD
jgi:hypothetical protein